MILGVGTDIVAVARIHQGIARHGERFARRMLADSEFAIYLKHTRPAQFLAKRFAAKEAVVKALGCGFSDGISMRHVIVCNDACGKPAVVLTAQAAKKAAALSAGEIHLSLADEREYAVAYVTILKTY